MVKMKKKLKNILKSNSNYYQIKTRNRDKELCTMSREIKNLKESILLQNSGPNTEKSINFKNREKKQLSNHFKVFKKIKNKKKLQIKKDLHINIKTKKKCLNGPISKYLINNENCHNLSFTKNSKKNKNNLKSDNPKKFNEIFKYIYKNKEYFELKEVLGLIYDELNIELDSPNSKLKDREKFKLEMNNMLKKNFLIYYNKILVIPENLYNFLNYLSTFVKFDAKEILKLLYKKCKAQKIEEKISLDQFFNPTLFLVEK